MIIRELQKFGKDGRTRIQATVHWEAVNEPAREIFFETEDAFGRDLTLNPDAFLAGCLAPAMHVGERRICIEGDVCPMLREGLDQVMAFHCLWTHGRLRPLTIESGLRNALMFPDRVPRAGLFLSGGIDSLCALRINRQNYPPEHPGSVQDGLLVHGFDIGGVMARGSKYHVFERTRAHMSPVAEEAQVTLIPVYTNIRHLFDQRELWLERFHGAVLAAAGHAFAARLHQVDIASTYDPPNLHPNGSHPLTDTAFSSADVHVRHTDLPLSRLDKHRIVARWETAFQNFRVCLANPPDKLNCGQCEKCIRTRTELVALGILPRTRAFVEDDVTAEELMRYDITIRGREYFYRDMIQPLRDRGRLDLAAAIEQKLKLSS
jgi:hypothetical protein